MDDLRLHAVAARVVAWHNRHPLARRITTAQVDSVGYVALPYTAPGLPPPAPAVASVAAAAPTPEPAPAPPAPAPVEIDPPIEIADSGSFVIDVDPQTETPPGSDSSAMTIEVELTTPEQAESAPMQAPVPEAEPPTSPERSAPETVSAATDVTDATDATDVDPAVAESPLPAAARSSLRARVAEREPDHAASPRDSAAATSGPRVAAQGTPRTLVYSEDILAPMPPPQVMAWLQAHGLDLTSDPVDGPVRRVAVDPALLPDGAGLATLWVATATVETGGQRTCLLVGAVRGGGDPPVLGRRLWSRPRVGGAMLLPVVLVGALCAWLLRAAPPAAAAPPPVAANALASSASAASAASAPESPVAAATAASAAAAASAPEPGASAALADAEAQLGRARPARLPGLLDDAAKAQAREAVAALRAQRQASAPVAATGTETPTAAPAAAVLPAPNRAPAVAAAPAAAPATLFGLSTRLLRTRAEAEQLQAAFQALLAGTTGSQLRVEMLPVGEDWRVVGWPYTRREDAERARTLLQSRGLRVELVDF